MINILIPKFTKIETSQVPLLNRSSSNQKSLQLQLNSPAYLRTKTKDKEQKSISVKKTDFEKFKQILEWRKKTELPIVKVKSWNILAQKQTNEEVTLDLCIELDSPFKSLNDFANFSFIYAVYVLKESLIGFERLCYRFGHFDIESEHIKFNESGNCKVWISKNCYSNQFNSQETKTQNDFIFSLCQIVKSKTTKSSNSCAFFKKIENSRYFFQAIGAIDAFAKLYRISIPSSLQNLDECKSPLLKGSMNLNPNHQRSRPNLTISNQVPAFIKKNQQKKKKSHQTSTPSLKKNVGAMKKSLFDRSPTNISARFSTFTLLREQSIEKQILKTSKLTKDQSKIQVNAFSQGLNIRLIQATKKPEASPLVQQVSVCASVLQNNPESKKGALGRISDFDSSEGQKSRFSLYHCKSKKYLNQSANGSNMIVTVAKPKKIAGPQSQGGIYIPNKAKHSKELKLQAEIHEDFEHLQVDSSKLSPHGKQTRQKRKFSGDFDSFSSRASQKIQEKPKNVMPNFLNVPRNRRNKDTLSKSPSHQVISLSSKQVGSESDENKDQMFLRGTLLIPDNWDLNDSENNNKKDRSHLPDTKQTPREEKPKITQIKKLANMGRQVGQNSETNECEFELEFGTKIQKEKSIRNEILNILN